MTLRVHLAILVACLIAESTSVCSDGNGGCFPETSNVAKMFAATSTCGDPPNLYCPPYRQTELIKCLTCNATGDDTHPEELAVDGSFSTFWQAATFKDALNEVVNVSVNLSGTFQLDKSVITFNTYRPQLMILEKSNDYGMTWTPLQYYADNCGSGFTSITSIDERMRSELPNENGNTIAFCIQQDTTLQDPETGGTVTYDAATRYGANRFDVASIVEHTLVTNLRARFLDLDTRGDVFVSMNEETFAAYYYAIEEWEVDARCYCYGHSNECVTDMGKITDECVCSHNTAGPNCDRCLPLFNNKPFMKGNSTHDNPCEVCECNNHSDSCVYDEAKGFGVCQNCQHNTTGDMCEMCLPNLFRNPSKALSDPDVCLACQCSSLGAIGQQCNSSGLCTCKTNVEGAKCDTCKAGFFGLSSTPNGCQACGCHNGGSDPGGNGSCDVLTGQCVCKANVIGLQCDTCKPGFYGLDGNSPEGCPNACSCSLSTSTSTVCDPVTGQCPCRTGMTGQNCDAVESGRFLPYLEGIVYEAEEATLTGAATIERKREVDPSTFTGIGGALLTGAGDSVSFRITVPSRSIRYYLIVRYQSSTSTSLSVRFGSENASRISIQAVQDAGTARLNTAHRSGGAVFDVIITSENPGDLFIDSVVLFPEKDDILAFASLDPAQQNATESCYANREVPVHSLSQIVTDTCRNHTIQANAWLFNGTLDCDCFPTNASSVCEAVGGQCNCDPSVGGRSCSSCAYGFFGFSGGQCQACGCSQMGSASDECDALTGQCSCRQFTTGLNCDSCIANYYNLSDCRECECNATFSESLQCSEDGICSCKVGIDGAKCSGGCSLGFFNLSDSGCTDCGCNSISSSGCDPVTGECVCYINWTGPKCENCSDSYFDKAGECHECFCYGHSTDCESAEGYGTETIVSKSNFDLDLNGWTTDGGFPVSHLDFSTSVIPRVVIKSTSNADYFVAPSKFTGNQRLAYFQHLSFELGIYQGSSTPYTGHSDGDVVIKGAALQYPITATIDPLPSGDFQSYSIQLIESNFRLGNASGRAVTIGEMFLTLQDVDYLHIRANFYEPPLYSETMLDNIVLRRAVLSVNATETSVEQCQCPIGYEGLSCERCQNGYTRAIPNGNELVQCVLCQCNGHSDQCDADTGECFACKDSTTGLACDQCSLGYYGNATVANGCQRCPCLSIGSSVNTSCSLSSDGLPTCESCAEGYTERFCNACADGFLVAPGGGCQPCACSDKGTGCDPVTGICSCIEGFTGPTCEECSPGSFDYSSGCLSCFCYGHASDCRSASGFEVANVSSDFEDAMPNGWQTIDALGVPTAALAQFVAVNRNPNFALKPVNGFAEYFRLPQQYLDDKRLAYRRQLSFDLALDGGSAIVSASSAGDFVIKGTSMNEPIVASLNNIPSPLPAFTTYSISLVETSFTVNSTSGRNVTISEFLDILSDIEYMYIRANFFQAGQVGKAVLDNVILYVAAFTGTTSLTDVENCTCDEGHAGLLCDECEPGYKREVVNGTTSDRCVPCQCNGHSNRCDVLTGVCLNCTDNTHGDFCESCAPGFYGNATRGDVDDCSACPCPFDAPPNQFSATCYLDRVNDEVVCDDCLLGHAGLRCERCDDGYYGRPDVVDGSCQVCNCSDNVDLTQTGNCNTTTGRCLKCVNNTAGFFCEECADEYFGDPLADTCQACGCNPVGSATGICNKTSGICTCRPNVIGDKCDQCASLHFGFDSGMGCTACDCDPIGSFNSTCNLVNGQCHCRNNVDPTSRTCSSCQDTFFNLTLAGCQACVCNETNTISGSSSCNKVTGQCPCLNGISGVSCSNCEPGFFGSPPGCHDCGPCYANWTNTIKDLLTKIQDQDARVKTLIATRYRNQTTEELASNVTTLRSLLTTIMTNFDDNTTPLSVDVNQLSDRLTQIENEFNSHSETVDRIEAKLDEAETKLNQTGDFDGTVEVAAGVNRNSTQLTIEANLLNATADDVSPRAQALANEIQAKSDEVNAFESESRSAEQLVQAGLRRAEKAKNDTDWVNDAATTFDVVHGNNSRRLTALEAQRNSLSSSLRDYLVRGSAAVERALEANVTAANAVSEAQMKNEIAVEEKMTADELLWNVTAPAELADKLYNDSAALNSSSFETKTTTENVSTNVRSAMRRLDSVEASLERTKETANATRSLTAPSVSTVESVAKMINETIVPEAEINATISQSRQSKDDGLSILSVAQRASNLSAQASDLVQTIETDLADASSARDRATSNLDTTEFETSSLVVALDKVHEDATDASTTSSEAVLIAQAAQRSVDATRSCRNDGLAVLQQTVQKAMNACLVTGPAALSNARSVARQVAAVNESQATEASAADSSTASSLKMKAEDVHASAANATQIEMLKDLLAEFVDQKRLLEEQRSKAAAHEQTVTDLLDKISTQCSP